MQYYANKNYRIRLLHSTEVVSNYDFAEHTFLNDDGTPFPLADKAITERGIRILRVIQERSVCKR